MLASVLLAGFQDNAASALGPFDRVVPVEIAATDPVLEGHGPSKRVAYTVPFSGTLHVWTRIEGDFDTLLRVEDSSGTLLGEDDDSGGRPAPYLRLEVEPGKELAIAVAGSKPAGAGKTELHLVAAPETDETRAEAEAAEQEMAEIEDLRRARDLEAARARMEALVEHIVHASGAAESELLAERAALAASKSEALALLRSTERARRFVLSHRLRTLPEAHRDLQGARANLAITIRALGDLPGARALQEKVRDVYERTLPDDDPDLSLVRFNLAATLAMLGDLREASALEEQVLEVRSRTLPDDHPSLQASRANHALTIRALGDLAGARALQEKVLEVFSRILPPEDPNLLLARTNLAVTIKELGDLPRARELEEKVLGSLSRTLPGDHPDLQRARLNLAATLYPLGDLAGARALLEQALEVLARTMPDDHPDLQLARTSLAVTIRALGDVAGARALQEKVLEIRSRTLPDDHPDLQKARQSLAITIGMLGDLEAARALHEKVFEVCSRTLLDDHPDLQAARVNLAGTMRALGDLAGARALEEKVLEVRSRTLPESHPDLQLARQNLAVTLCSLGVLARARALEDEVLDVRLRTLPDEHPDLQAARVNLALTIALQGTEGERGRYGALVEAFARGLRHATRTAIVDASSREAEERVASRSNDLGWVLSCASGLGRFASDPIWEREAFLFSEETRGASLTSARLARRSSRDPGYPELCSRRLEASADLARLARTAASAESVASARGRVEEADRALVRRASQFAAGAPDLLELDLDVLARGVGPAEAIVAYRSYARSTIAAGDPPRKEQVQSLCAFVVRHAAGSASGERSPTTLRRVELGPIAPIERAVDGWRGALGTASGRGVPAGTTVALDSRRQGEGVRELVLDPLRRELDGVERVIVAPDDVLNAVPLDALPAGTVWCAGGPGSNAGSSSPAEPLGRYLRIDVRSSLLELLAHDEPPAGPPGLLALGGIDFGTTTDSASERTGETSGVLRGGEWEQGFPALPGTLAEVRALGERFTHTIGREGDTLLLEGASASREKLFELSPRARFLHVATHGWFAPASIRSSEDAQPLDARTGLGERTGTAEIAHLLSPMLLCGLALAGANQPQNELGRIPGLVTAEEISALDLSNCELAVLSACDTNVGVRRAGQGVASLQRALHMAGARSVITSLWSVPDEATKDLMLDFYRRLWVEKKPKSKALWEAKMKIRDEKDEAGRLKYTPRDWAAWVLTGDPD